MRIPAILTQYIFQPTTLLESDICARARFRKLVELIARTRMIFWDGRYSCSICSADFNDWVGKNTSTKFKGSYIFTGEWEMQDWNLGNTYDWPL